MSNLCLLSLLLLLLHYQISLTEAGTCSLSCQNGTCKVAENGEEHCRCYPHYGGRLCDFEDETCHPSPCQNGGTCQSRKTHGRIDWSCMCPARYTGSSCQHEVSCECLYGDCNADGVHCNCYPGYTGKFCNMVDHCFGPSPCRNGGNCTSTESSYICSCALGWGGHNCTDVANQCPGYSQYCQNGGTCIDFRGSQLCMCPPNFHGVRCEYSGVLGQETACASNPCSSNGFCIDRTPTSYQCRCNPGFEGENCERNVNECASSPCKNGALCKDGANTFVCQCTAGWTGATCEDDIDECTLNPQSCLNGATCLNSDGSYRCTCVNGWTGFDCGINDNDCAKDTCFFGATCVDGVATFTCECPFGKTGLLCHLDDVCVSDPPPCAPGSKCDTNPVNGQALCTCPDGYEGADCSVDKDECELGNNPCAHLGSCVNYPGSFACVCIDGYTGPRCEINVNECESHPCQNDATCLDKIGTFKCICKSGYTGEFCEQEINECTSDPCMHGGECVDQINMYTCSCLPGFTGKNCETNIDDCASTPCVNHMRCVDGITSYKCVCQPGFTGENCEENIEECQSSPCHYGECIDGVNQFTCKCQPGYSGILCDTPIDECAMQPCQNGGTCTDREAAYDCTCPLGTSGKNCEVNLDECASNPCVHGTCVDGINTYSCVCNPGYTGFHCIEDIDECQSNPCYNQGTCVDKINGFQCRCLPGYSGTRCYSDTDECSSNPCVNGGNCIDGVNRFSCSCRPGFEGEICQHNINECESNPCHNNGRCVDLVNKYRCECRTGYTGVNCGTEINECSPNPCLNKANCSDLVGRFLCTCQVGYTGTRCETALTPCDPPPCRNNGVCTPSEDYLGYTCACREGFQGPRCESDINECVMAPCLNGGTCHNLVPGYVCRCPPGYTAHNCQTDINDCAPDPCMNGGTCVDQVNGFECVCQRGFEGDRCERDVDECSSSPCMNGATCIDYVDSYVCTCSPGFRGETCEENIYDCHPSSCLNGGTCIDGVASYSCACRPGFVGTHCEHDVDECASNPCRNGATCRHAINKFYCVCPYGYQGPTCEEMIDRCNPSPCVNGGSCGQSGTSYRCVCPQGYGGIICDVPRTSCADAARSKGVGEAYLCQHGGSCHDVGATHRCSCTAGFTGSYCETDINECGSDPCLNGATCNDYLNSFTCDCLPGYEGTTCADDINECASNPCQNGGDCIDLVNSYKCACPVGTSGTRCQIDEDECSSSPCMNGGQCRDTIGGFTCHCSPGFDGPRCQGDINECHPSPCSNQGTLNCVQGVNSFTCTCKEGFTGTLCDKKASSCSLSPCLNGAVCVDDPVQMTGYRCFCKPGFRGTNCEKMMSKCDGGLVCYNGGTCVEAVDGNESCMCPANYNGKACIYYIPGEPPGPGVNDVTPPDHIAKVCVDASCRVLSGNGRCDSKCNTYECDYDGGDCSLGNPEPFQNCSTALQCQDRFGDGSCDQQCNTEECLFDGRDCDRPHSSCPAKYNEYCSENYANGHCDEGCNTVECGWDGLDCDKANKHEPVPGLLIVIVIMPPEELLERKADFLRWIGQILSSVVLFQEDKNGEPRIEPIYGDLPGRSRRSVSEEFWKKLYWGSTYQDHVVNSTSRKRVRRAAATASKAYLIMNNYKCDEMGESCTQSAATAASYYGATQAITGTDSPFPISAVSAEMPHKPKHVPPEYSYIIGAVVGFVLVLAIIYVLTQRKRKKEKGTLWAPEGFPLNKKQRKEPIGQDDYHLKPMLKDGSVSGLGTPYMNNRWDDAQRYVAASQCTLNDAEEKNVFLPDDSQSFHQPQIASSSRDDLVNGEETRKWTSQHLEAADIPREAPAAAVADLTPPPQIDLNADVNAPGPDGLTPLMVASMRGGVGVDSNEDDPCGEDQGNEGSDSIIAGLIVLGASLKAKTDRTGETALHLAARYSRADAAKRLLDAEADPNVRDVNGRTPIHAAIAADAQGVFQILLRNRVTDLDAKSSDGTTPLMLAARIAVEGMVDELINAHADINALDEHGKSALHWAAAVNNVDAVTSLLRAGCNKDAQTEREETPLFLAAKEGSHEAVRTLLDYHANREITDHLDRLPQDIAQERMHTDIVDLLVQYKLIRSSGLQSGHVPSHLNGHPLMRDSFMGMKPQGSKKSRRQSGKSDKQGRRQKKLSSSQTAPMSVSSNEGHSDVPAMSALVHPPMGSVVEGSLSPGNASLSSPSTNYTGESSLSPPLSCMGAGLPYQMQQYNGSIVPAHYNLQGVEPMGFPNDPRLSHFRQNGSLHQHGSHGSILAPYHPLRIDPIQHQEYLHANEAAMQQHRHPMYNNAMPQNICQQQMPTAYQTMPAAEQTNQNVDRPQSNQRRYSDLGANMNHQATGNMYGNSTAHANVPCHPLNPRLGHNKEGAHARQHTNAHQSRQDQQQMYLTPPSTNTMSPDSDHLSPRTNQSVNHKQLSQAEYETPSPESSDPWSSSSPRSMSDWSSEGMRSPPDSVVPGRPPRVVAGHHPSRGIQGYPQVV